MFGVAHAVNLPVTPTKPRAKFGITIALPRGYGKKYGRDSAVRPIGAGGARSCPASDFGNSVFTNQIETKSCGNASAPVDLPAHHDSATSIRRHAYPSRLPGPVVSSPLTRKRTHQRQAELAKKQSTGSNAGFTHLRDGLGMRQTVRGPGERGTGVHRASPRRRSGHRRAYGRHRAGDGRPAEAGRRIREHAGAATQARRCNPV